MMNRSEWQAILAVASSRYEPSDSGYCVDMTDLIFESLCENSTQSESFPSGYDAPKAFRRFIDWIESDGDRLEVWK